MAAMRLETTKAAYNKLRAQRLDYGAKAAKLRARWMQDTLYSDEAKRNAIADGEYNLAYHAKEAAKIAWKAINEAIKDTTAELQVGEAATAPDVTRLTSELAQLEYMRPVIRGAILELEITVNPGAKESILRPNFDWAKGILGETDAMRGGGVVWGQVANNAIAIGVPDGSASGLGRSWHGRSQ